MSSLLIKHPLHFHYPKLRTAFNPVTLEEHLRRGNSFAVEFQQYGGYSVVTEIQSRIDVVDTFIFSFHGRYRLRIMQHSIILKTVVVTHPQVLTILNVGLAGFPYKYHKLEKFEGDSSFILLALRKDDGSEPSTGWVLMQQNTFSPSRFDEDICQPIS